MKAEYLVEIQNPEQNIVKVTVKFEREKGAGKFRFFLPSWSPGSYMIRDYARHIRTLQITQENGEYLNYKQIAKNQWEIDWASSELKKDLPRFEISYVIYLFELTVRTSHVNVSHAFLHGPSYLIGATDQKIENPTIEFRFPPLWSKLSTSLTNVEGARGKFLYTAKDYDELIDCPVEIGCHETDGFMALGKPHHLAYWGSAYPHLDKLKKDIKQIVETVALHLDNDLPYDQYLFLTLFAPGNRGGLEHLNSTALIFDSRKLANRRDYISYLSLVAHEYFHLWNVKRIRPRELGPFDYHTENYTAMLWLAEGLTSLMDDLFVYRSGLCTLEEYLDQIKGNVAAYYSIPGKKFHSLEQSSFNAWVKLYKADENYKNSSISYYLKGGLVFTALHALLLEKGKSVDDLIMMLWEHYGKRPHEGVNKEEVYGMIRSLGGEDVENEFIRMVETTEDIDFISVFEKFGCKLNWDEPAGAFFGWTWEYHGKRAIAKTVELDSPAYKAGINPGDEIIFVNGMRFLRDEMNDIFGLISPNETVSITLARLGKMETVEVIPTSYPRTLKDISVTDRTKAEKAFSFSRSLGQSEKA